MSEGSNTNLRRNIFREYASRIENPECQKEIYISPEVEKTELEVEHSLNEIYDELFSSEEYYRELDAYYDQYQSAEEFWKANRSSDVEHEY